MIDADAPKIKVYTDDESLKIFGELLSNKSSRDIIRSLIDEEMYKIEIVKKLGLRTNLIIHHLHKMESIGLLETTHKKIIRKGKEHRFFKIPDGMLIVPNTSNEATKERFFKKVLRSGIKFAVIGITGLIPAAIQAIGSMAGKRGVDYDSNLLTSDSIALGLAIIICGLVIERIYIYRKNKRVGLS